MDEEHGEQQEEDDGHGEEEDDEHRDDEEEVEAEARRTGPPKKRWMELGLKQKKRRSQMLFDALKKTSDESGIEPVQMVGSLLQR